MDAEVIRFEATGGHPLGCWQATAICDFCGREAVGHANTRHSAMISAYAMRDMGRPPWGPATKADGAEGLGCPWCLERIYGTYARRDDA